VNLPMEPRMLALALARARVAVGAAGCALPGLAAAFAHGDRAPAARSLARMVGARDVALGLGALTSVKERTQDAEWVGTGAVVDVVDGLALLLTRGLPARARLMGLAAVACGAAGLAAARALADERVPPDAVEAELSRPGMAGARG
jgi:peptide-methionine (R)-S-oxide reductase